MNKLISQKSSIARTLVLLLATLISLQVTACNAGELNRIDNISQQNLLTKIETKQNLLILDVRSPKEYKEGHIPGAINIEYDQIADRINEIANYKNSTVVVYCERGVRANVAEKTLASAGFKSILHLEGDMSAWRKSNLPIEN